MGGEDAQHPEMSDCETRLSREGSARGSGRLRDFVTKFAGVQGLIGMHGGLPPASVFPVSAITLTLGDGSTVEVCDPAVLCAAQQYNVDPLGYKPLRDWATAFTERTQRPVRSDLRVLMTNGSSQSIEIVMRMLLNPGDAVLVEEFIYSNTIEMVTEPIGFKPYAVELDKHGLVPESLEAAIAAATAAGTPPRVLYTVPTAHNPTGATMTMERKRSIYRICQQHDVVILEDDPYCLLQFGSGDAPVPGTAIEPGFLHLDTDGRVVRLDTFAKTVAPGFRLGWITTKADLIGPLTCAVQASTMGPSGPSQVILHSILAHWGEQGFEQHIRNVQTTYQASAAALHGALVEHVGGLASWAEPHGGMFVWLKIEGVDDAGEIMGELIDKKVVVCPGSIFAVARLNNPEYKCPYIRLAFSYMAPDLLREGAKRLGAVLRACTNGAAAA